MKKNINDVLKLFYIKAFNYLIIILRKVEY